MPHALWTKIRLPYYVLALAGMGGVFRVWYARELGAGALRLFLKCPPIGELLKQIVLSFQSLEIST